MELRSERPKIFESFCYDMYSGHRGLVQIGKRGGRGGKDLSMPRDRVECHLISDIICRSAGKKKHKQILQQLLDLSPKT